MDYDDTLDYQMVKEAILSKYEINTETYRQQFRSTDIRPGETPKEVYVQLKLQEVPQATTGFSPFELLDGHQVRWTLDVLKESWEGGKPEGKQKTWYDRKARFRTLTPGQEVLLLLPSSDNKLLAKWQGPYKLHQRIGPVTYKISTSGRQMPFQTCHINLLKEWRLRPEPVSQQLYVRAIKEEEEAAVQYFPTGSGTLPLDLTHLSTQQQMELKARLEPDIIQERLGYTTLVQH
ncbi:hypothetical protein SKAU_G00059530 [Synaphobranchus kaupii]|uniref:Integrase p58-like C-terminal domain-containing protein n=1 Tax=Synaphobranchus kaupii TaxID=118154 RepID=A0A9Q1G5G9_SYNKA|nr:hypothetical protein SKAU_G00059530 [Synaphobranchus kaupii]